MNDHFRNHFNAVQIYMRLQIKVNELNQIVHSLNLIFEIFFKLCTRSPASDFKNENIIWSFYLWKDWYIPKIAKTFFG